MNRAGDVRKGATTNGYRLPWDVEADEQRKLAQVALGELPADLVIHDGDLANVYTGEVQEHCSLAIKGRHVAFIGRDIAHTIGPETRVIDATGKAIIPGLIDGHTHVFNRYEVGQLARYALPTATTTVISEILELVLPLGVDAIPALLDSFRAQPVRVFATLPALVSIDPPWPGLAPPVEEYARFLDDDLVLGVGESYWANVLRDDGRLRELFSRAHRARKPLEGHTAGARDRRLQAYLCHGQSSCHEPITADEALALLRCGVHVLLRQGAIRRDLDGVAPIKDMPIDLRRLAICSDSVDPVDLLAGRYMNTIVQQAIDLGFDPVAAVRMASLNVAEHFHLDYWLGGLAPGKLADLAVLSDRRCIEPEYVVLDGRIVAQEGVGLIGAGPARYPETFFNAVRLSANWSARDFRVDAPHVRAGRVRAIEQVTDLVTKETTLDLPADSGEVMAQPERDVIKVAAIERRRGDGERFVGFLVGNGLRRGAFATTMTWDSTALIVVGADDADMAVAVNEVVRLGGGAAVCAGGKVLASFAAPVGGFVSQRPLPEIVADTDALQRAAMELGSRHTRALLSIETLTTAAIPHLRINHAGYYSVRDSRFLGLYD